LIVPPGGASNTSTYRCVNGECTIGIGK
jgi:hypothetical protein